jgi:hypothetical protein
MRQLYRLLLFYMLTAVVGLAGCGDNPVNDAASESPEVQTDLGAGAELTGRVLPSGVSPLIVLIRNGVDFRSTVADEEGYFTISDLPSGEYSLQVIATGFFTDISVARIELEKGESHEVAPIVLRQQSAGATLLGQVINKSDGQPLAGAAVQVECAPRVCAALGGTSGPDGTFSVKIWSGLGANVNVRKHGYQTVLVRVKALNPEQEFDVGKIELVRIPQ